MKLLPLQWAAVVVIAIDAIVLVSGALTGAALLPAGANLVLVLTGVALLVVLIVQTGGGLRLDGLATLFRLLRETLPKWAIALAAVAFYGGWLVAFVSLSSDSVAGNLKYENGKYTTSERKVVRELTREQYEAALTANQRAWAGFSLAFAGGTLGFAGIARRIKENS
ncbi:hypothetical protein SAMN04488564_104669 [Lentzea waywayandensis]|uniref:Uncharacterized protein n=1 Tax=Lentzea waywayandensis TaxID=84724 RepID=A0A1I6EJE8_9PSEU|nr:hypothetical protein [Lentzea waywayandensis]SFR17884.1 hypothetical protein SAMN04488564_104669 [Lentzea waywayandensis]